MLRAGLVAVGRARSGQRPSRGGCVVKYRGRRGYFYVRVVGCLVGASLGVGGFLLANAAAGGATSSLSNYAAVYTTTTGTTTTTPTTPKASPPTNSSAPTISGSPRVGGTLVAHTGTWTNKPTSFAYQ